MVTEDGVSSEGEFLGRAPVSTRTAAAACPNTHGGGVGLGAGREERQ